MLSELAVNKILLSVVGEHVSVKDATYVAEGNLYVSGGSFELRAADIVTITTNAVSSIMGYKYDAYTEVFTIYVDRIGFLFPFKQKRE